MSQEAMMIDIQGIEKDRVLRARVIKRVGEILETLKIAPVKAKVTFFDENGPKGGRAMRCAINVRMPRRPVVHVEHVETTNRLAFDGTVAALERQLEGLRERERENRRHPKKYFVAKRLQGS
jgi:ribosome-associated translation inhibitor RaiA